jgi:hypothetical protein
MADTDPIEHFRSVLQNLLARAKKDEVNWQLTDVRGAASSYLVQFPASAIRIDFYSPESEPDVYIARLFNHQGKSVQSFYGKETEKANWELLASLTREAYRSLTGWDKALADAEEALKKEGSVGTEDIPF